MADTVYTDTVTLLTADTMNDLNRLHYTILSDPADIAAIRTALVATMTWTTPAFNAGDFTAGGSQTWTVASGDVTTHAYTILHKIMIVSFVIVNTDVAGTPDIDLKIAIPASKTATKTIYTPIYISDNGTDSIGFAFVSAAGTVISLRRVDGANWAASTGNTDVRGQIVFEIN